MRDDVPAALPLIAFAAALGAGPYTVHIGLVAAGLLVIAALLTLRRCLQTAGVVAFASLGFAVAAHAMDVRRLERLALGSTAEGRFATVYAPIERDWSQRPGVSVLHSSRFTVAGQQVRTPLAIYARFLPPQIGMEAAIQVEGHLRPDRRGGFTISVKSARLLRYEGRLSLWSPASWNRVIANRLRRHAATRPDEIAMIEALLLGRGERLAEQTKEDFKRGGTYHLLVFSGLQISLAAALITMLLRWAGAARAADFSLLGFALVAPAFIGPEASVSRASTAIALYALSRIAARPTTFENLWCVAALVRLVLVPGDLVEPAFHLTYAGAGALLFIGRPLARTGLRGLGYAIGAEVAIAPLTLFHFHQYALGGSLMTILMTPVTFVMLAAGALFAITGSGLLLDLVGILNALCTAMNRAAAPASGFFTAPSAVSVVIGGAGALLAVASVRGPRRTIAVVLALFIPTSAAFTSFRARRVVDAPRLIALDVGQGDAFLVRSGQRALLIDGGGRQGDVRFGENVLLPLLLDRGVRTLDALILSHAHPDHCGGLAGAIRHLRVREILISPRRFHGECAALILEAAQKRRTPVRLLRGGEILDLGEVRAVTTVLQTRFRRAPENNSSVLVRIVAGTRSVLLTGDIERDAERELAPDVGTADVLKVPHHGSRTSSTPRFFDAVRPRIAIVSCGRHNVFGHPHPEVLDALRGRQVRIWRTDVSGSVEVSFRDGRIEVRPEIDTHK